MFCSVELYWVFGVFEADVLLESTTLYKTNPLKLIISIPLFHALHHTCFEMWKRGSRCSNVHNAVDIDLLCISIEQVVHSPGHWHSTRGSSSLMRSTRRVELSGSQYGACQTSTSMPFRSGDSVTRDA